MEKLLKFSANTLLIDKIPPHNSRAFAEGFQPLEATLEDLAEKLIRNGCAFSYQFAGGERLTRNFLCTDFLAVDIDDGCTLDEALEHPIVKQYCSLLYTTPSHSPDRHRFRLVFVLPRTITDVKEVIAASRSLSRRLGGDMSATDGARLFYGSRNCHYQLLNQEISNEFLDELIADGMIKPESDTAANASLIAASRSDLQLPPDTTFITGDNQILKFRDVVQKTPVRCIFHEDKRPSAFVALSKKGNRYFYCSVCQLTRWIESNSTPDYDFHSFENTIRDLKSNPIKTGPYIPLESPDKVDTQWSVTNVTMSSDRYIQLDEIKPGLMFIKSPKGSGKTTFLSKALEKVLFKHQSSELSVFEENSDDDAPEPIYTDKRVLLIGHRQALIRDLCKRLWLNCYLDDKGLAKGDVQHRQRRYGVCLDSLSKVKDQKFDVILIDEVEQVLGHFLAETVGNRSELFSLMSYLIKNAKTVVALDADLGWTSFETLTRLAKATHIDDGRSPPIHIYINEWKPESKKLNLYVSREHLIHHMMHSIVDGKRVFVSSNSKARIGNLEKAIQELEKQLQKTIKVMTITSENSRSTETQDFITHIKTKILDYQVVLSSPSLGTGVDITFENDGDVIDCVYGIYENKINTHTEIDQQLSRVRNPKEVHVWVSPSRLNFETEFEVVKHDCLKHNLISLTHSGFQGEVEDEDKENYGAFLTMGAMIIAFQRASKNRLKWNFIDHKIEQGWEIIDVPVDEEAKRAGKAFYDEGVAVRAEEEIAAILKAKPLEQDDFDELQERLESNDEIVSRDEFFSYLRTRIELFYRERISRELILLDDKGRYRKCIQAFGVVTNRKRIAELINDKNKKNAEKGASGKAVIATEKILHNRYSSYILLYELFSSTPIFKGGIFEWSKPFTRYDLSKFVDTCRELKPYIETHLDLNLRRDFESNPVAQLKKFLEMVGLKLWWQRAFVKDGQKMYAYWMAKNDWRQMQEINVRRDINPDEWDFYNKLHGFEARKLKDELDDLIFMTEMRKKKFAELKV